jgi:hypothetical protein
MYQDLLNEIALKRSKYSGSMQPPCPTQEIARLRDDVRRKLSTELPNGYAQFLATTNGFDWNGLVIYASATSLIVGHQDRHIPGFVETNLMNREEDEWYHDLLVFGNSGLDRYVFRISTKEYQILDITSLDLTEKHDSFDSLISEALRIHLE